MGRKITTEIFKQEIEELHPNKYTILGEYMGAHKKILTRYNACQHEYEAKAYKIRQGKECPICYGGFQLTQEQFEEKVRKMNPHLTVTGKYTNMRDTVEVFCSVCNSTTNPIADTIANKSRNGCGVCTGNQVRIGYNDMWTTAPHIAELLENPEDGYKYTDRSDKRTNFVCPFCSSVLNRKIKNVYTNGLCCNCIRKDASFSEKFLYSMFDQLGEKYCSEHIFDWSTNVIVENGNLCGTKRYDIYIPSKNMIIEAHGMQHYQDNGFIFQNGRSLEEEIENDKIKQKLALDNNISEYIVLDCRRSDISYLKKSILQSKLNQIYDLSIVDWAKCLDYAKTKIVTLVADLWNQELSVSEIAETLHKSRTTVRERLVDATILNLCDYSVEESRLRGAKLNKKRKEELVTA